MWGARRAKPPVCRAFVKLFLTIGATPGLYMVSPTPSVLIGSSSSFNKYWWPMITVVKVIWKLNSKSFEIGGLFYIAPIFFLSRKLILSFT